MADYKRIEHAQGLTPNEHFIVKDSGGTAIDIESEGWSIDCRVRRSSASAVIETFSTTSGDIVLSTTVTGRFDFSGFDGAEFSDVTFRGLETEFIYDIQLTDGSGNIHDGYYGEWVLRSNI